MSSKAKQRPRSLGVDDLRDEHRIFVREKIEETLNEFFVPLEPNLSVEAVYVAGSFADGEARRLVSDLDVRVIVSGDVQPANAKQMNTTLKNEVTGQLPTGRAFGYVDPQVYPTRADAADVDDLPLLDPRADQQLHLDTDQRGVFDE
ncbi:nucleotidyltransferase domain-containing protein [Halopiger xanaduensis]|uniref:Polymerase nucleotidyl transferase domain-containing protein n=1 Tax=Halopiger xanaduensis (strain DSM 18323 / JCM 14033 / SH-6) TaxID=797210 RepID=F8DEV6_HALXS|nr:nucleotidyltransferase domain-containing protein [Halopiger xanaduensis]AEH39497.1 hypothetical protein Halxa_0257 [Halopiger xanaduensis SH-6]